MTPNAASPILAAQRDFGLNKIGLHEGLEKTIEYAHKLDIQA